MDRHHGIAEVTAQLLVEDLRALGSVTYQPEKNGFAVLEDAVMFGFVDEDGTVYLRATSATTPRFQALGSAKHPRMPYWTVPSAIAADTDLLCEFAHDCLVSAEQ